MTTIIEDKTGSELLNAANKNPDGSLKVTEAEWADSKIFQSTSRRLKNLQNATRTFAGAGYVGPSTPPSVDDLKKIKNIAFTVTGNWPAFTAAVDAAIQKLRAAFPGYTFALLP